MGRHRHPAADPTVVVAAQRLIEVVDHATTGHLITRDAHERGWISKRYLTNCCRTEIQPAALTTPRYRWCPLVLPSQRKSPR